MKEQATCGASAPVGAEAMRPTPQGANRSAGRAWNPLATGVRAAEGSSYAAGVDGGGAVRPLDSRRPPRADLADLHAELRLRILGEGYPCVGARSAFNRLGYRLGLYPALGSAPAVEALLHDLYEFSHEFEHIGDQFVTFVAGFDGPAPQDEQAFEALIWAQLQAMHDIDRRHFAWDGRVSGDPEHPQFSFSLGARAYFIVGLHARASRSARRASRPTLVFNLHEQFERLRERGKFETMKQMIRSRDLAFHGSINPVLRNFGDASEARQYSGRAVGDDWACPFRPRTQAD